MFPHFQGQGASTMAAAVRAQKARPELAAIHAAVVEAASERYATESAGRAG